MLYILIFYIIYIYIHFFITCETFDKYIVFYFKYLYKIITYTIYVR